MLTRGSLLKRALAGVAAFYGARHLPPVQAAPKTWLVETFESGHGAVIASGGFCAPLEPFYEIHPYLLSSRPVRDALPSFSATRNGISTKSSSA